MENILRGTLALLMKLGVKVDEEKDGQGENDTFRFVFVLRRQDRAPKCCQAKEHQSETGDPVHENESMGNDLLFEQGTQHREQYEPDHGTNEDTRNKQCC